MRLLLLFPLAVSAVRILVSNDDGWAELNIRQLYGILKNAGHKVVISAPAVNKSGTGSRDSTAVRVGQAGCHFDSCPPYSAPAGRNDSEPPIHYYNSFPVSAVKHGISHVAPSIWDNRPDIVVAGFNVGCNPDISTLGSGTVGAACEAVKQGIPAIAFSGCTGSQISWQALVPNYAKVYANLSPIVTEELVRPVSSTNVTEAPVDSSTAYLPSNVWLNVNFGRSTMDQCTSSADFSFVLSRIAPAIPVIGDNDVLICDNGGRLPLERTVVNTPGCFASISVGDADTKQTAGRFEQEFVFSRLSSILSCLPKSRKIDL